MSQKNLKSKVRLFPYSTLKVMGFSTPYLYILIISINYYEIRGYGRLPDAPFAEEVRFMAYE